MLFDEVGNSNQSHTLDDTDIEELLSAMGKSNRSDEKSDEATKDGVESQGQV